MTRRVLGVLLGALLLPLAVAGPSAKASPGDQFGAAIAPGDVQPLSPLAYSVQISSLGSSSQSANNAHVAIPVGFLVDGASLTATTTASGSCSAAAWNVSLNLVSSIDAVAPGGAAAELCPGGELTIAFTATAPVLESTYLWTTTLFEDSSEFGLQGQQPSVTVDGTAPSAPDITSGPADPSNSSSASFSFSDEADASFACSLDGAGYTACPSPVTYTGLGEGTHAFAVKAIDPAGNESAATTDSWTIDLTPPPEPDITSAPPNPSNGSSATFAFSDDDSSATFRCRLDENAFAACSSPVTYTGLAEGTHTFRVGAVDAAGNQSTVNTYTWAVDLTPPPAPAITSAPPNVTASTSASFSFSDGDGTAAFRCRLDGQAFSACTSPISYTGLAEGSHTFGVRARDPAGNESGETSYTWFIDLTNPVVTIDPASEPPDPTNRTSASFVFTSNKAGSTFECRLDASAFVACTSPWGYSSLANGRHRVAVRATDSLGNQGLATIYEWTVDTIPPATTITGVPPASTNSRLATFAFTSAEAPSTFACSLDGGAFAACSSPKDYSGLVDGTHSFQVRATDRAGNTDPTPASYSWQIATPVLPDTTAPGAVLDPTRSVGYRRLKLAWALPADADFDHVEVVRSRSAKGAARAVVYDGAATAYTEKRFQNGTYYRYQIVAYDHSGNASPPVAVVVRPSVLLRSPRDGAVVHGPPLFRWAKVRSASYYNVQLFRGSHKVLSAWPAKTKLKVGRSWVYQGHRFRPRKGVYRWWVWPAYGPRSKAKYGHLLGTGRFSVR
jgi:hypothetical protein